MLPHSILVLIDREIRASTLPLNSFGIISPIYVCHAGKLIVFEMKLLITEIITPYFPMYANENIDNMNGRYDDIIKDFLGTYPSMVELSWWLSWKEVFLLSYTIPIFSPEIPSFSLANTTAYSRLTCLNRLIECFPKQYTSPLPSSS